MAHTHVTSEVLKTGSASTGSTVTNPYFKIASWEMGANQYFGAELLAQNHHYARSQVFITIACRTNNDFSLQQTYLLLSNVFGFSKNQLCICYKQESNKVLFELYLYITTAWSGLRFSVLNESLRQGGGGLKLFQTLTAYNQEPTDAVSDLPTGYTVIQAEYLPLSQDINPSETNTYDLGTSSYKWRKVYSDDAGS